MLIDVDRRITDDKFIQSLLARKEIQLESFGFDGYLPDGWTPRQYPLDARLFIDFIYEGPPEEPGNFVCRMILSGEALMEYLKIEGYDKTPLRSILTTEVKAITLRLWAFIKKVAQVEEFCGYLVKIQCPQSHEQAIDAGLFKTALLNDVATPSEAMAGTNTADEVQLITAAYIQQHFTAFSEQSILAALREELSDNEIIDRVMAKYRKNIQRIFKKDLNHE